MAQKVTIAMEKTGEYFVGVNVPGKEKADGISQPSYEVKGLAGAL